MARKYIQHRRAKSTEKKSSSKNSDVEEFYLLEKLYEAIRNDKEHGIKPSADREFFLMEKLYDAMRNDKMRNKRPEMS